MANNSPEQLLPIEHQETEPISILDFDQLSVGQVLDITLVDGRLTRLKIDQIDEEGNRFGRLSQARKTQLATEIKDEDWEELPHSLKLMGSCERVMVEGTKASVVGETKGSFEVGKSAWFEFVTELGNKTRVTYPILTISLLANEQGSNHLGLDSAENSDTIDSP